MTSEGIERIANLFLQDIKALTYTLDEKPKEKNIFKSSVKGGNVEIMFQSENTESGKFDNFKLVGKSGTTYATKVLNFQKENDEVIIDFPFVFVKEGEL